MFGRKQESQVDKIAEQKRKQELLAKAEENGNKPSTELTKRERLALEIYSRLSLEDYDDVEEYAVQKADALLIELAR